MNNWEPILFAKAIEADVVSDFNCRLLYVAAVEMDNVTIGLVLTVVHPIRVAFAVSDVLRIYNFAQSSHSLLAIYQPISVLCEFLCTRPIGLEAQKKGQQVKCFYERFHKRSPLRL
ncbi:MAG: hypothetical protein KF744_04790 [Taibaiella sp.]|nr:hypothetical protein [Taibaiella sp.]